MENNINQQINNLQSGPKKKIVVGVLVFIIVLIAGAGVTFILNKKEETRPQPKINKYCLNKDEVARKVANPTELKGLITDILNDQEVNNLHAQENLNDLFVRYIGCKIGEENGELADEELHQLGLDFINEPKTHYIRYELKPELAEYDKYAYEFHLKLAGSGRPWSDDEYRDYRNSKTFEELLYNFSIPLPQMCPYLSEKCFDSELRKSYIPASFCENLCPKVVEYEQNPDMLLEEMVVNSFKNWDNENILSDPNNKLLLSFRYLILYHLGDKELIRKTCDNASVDLRAECLSTVRGITDRIDNFRRDITACYTIPTKITNLICNNL